MNTMLAAETIVFTPRGEHDPLMTTARPAPRIAAKLAPDRACPAETRKIPLVLRRRKSASQAVEASCHIIIMVSGDVDVRTGRPEAKLLTKSEIPIISH